MNNYRKPFLLALAGNILFIAVLAGIWWTGRKPAQSQHAASPVANLPAQPAQDNLSAAAQLSAESPLAPVQLSAERLQSIGVKFGVVERKKVLGEIRTTGTVAIDETRLSYVQTRISGHIEQVFADSTYQYIRKDQPLFTIHSPELIAAEREYLLAKQNAQNLSHSTIPGVAQSASSLLGSSRERLEQWDIPAREIARLESSGEVTNALEIDSPVTGYITERNALPNLLVQPDTRLYTVADLSTVWVLAQIFQNDLARIHAGTPASFSLDSYPGRVFRGRVDFVYPDVDPATRTVRARLVFSNPNLMLKPGMFVNVNLQIPQGFQVVIPTSGVLQSGTRQIVFVDRGAGYLEPRDVQLGTQAGDEYIVLKGLQPGERIVTSANFLIDSESQLQAAIGSFAPPPPGAGAAAAMNGPTPQTQIEFSTDPAAPHKGINLYRVKLAGADGAPVSGAQVEVRSFMAAMPQMGMAAMKIQTQLSEKANGVYEGQVNFEDGGTWQLTIMATRSGATLATKQLSLNVEGGM
ncbi:MAG TPA: efflux RND transporter periplasmic adaptor subunit [Candidatus Acidoferrum sp.]|nr:efflux RND transporter periplasmic adaptor subunit [Candidatus Acidoferrum sp.]